MCNAYLNSGKMTQTSPADRTYPGVFTDVSSIIPGQIISAWLPSFHCQSYDFNNVESEKDRYLPYSASTIAWIFGFVEMELKGIPI